MKQAIESEASRKVLRQLAGDIDETFYEKSSVQFWFKGFWIIAVGVLFLLHYKLFGSGLYGHFVSFITGVIGLIGWNTIEPFLDVAEEEGLVYTKKQEQEQGEKDEDGE